MVSDDGTICFSATFFFSISWVISAKGVYGEVNYFRELFKSLALGNAKEIKISSLSPGFCLLKTEFAWFLMRFCLKISGTATLIQLFRQR